MTRTPLILLTLLAALPLSSQQRLTIVLDPARGGTEYGARIDEHTYEKQVTLDLANRLRSLLSARDFDVVVTRDGDSLVTNDQRAAIANQHRSVACLLLHATASGTGVHLWTSTLQPLPAAATAVLWDQAQSPFVERSLLLGTQLASAFSRAGIPVSSGRTWIRPLDNMQCPAVAIEIAPRNADTPVNDHAYQALLAGAVANQMLLWRGRADVVQSIVNPPPAPAPPKPEPKSESKPEAKSGITPAPQSAVPARPAAAPPGPTPVRARPATPPQEISPP